MPNLSVSVVTRRRMQAAERIWAILKQLPRLRTSQISAPLITDQAMHGLHVWGIRSLRELTLYQTLSLTGHGLRCLAGFRWKSLVLVGSDVTLIETLESAEVFPDLRSYGFRGRPAVRMVGLGPVRACAGILKRLHP